jgi:hypothetical protein
MKPTAMPAQAMAFACALMEPVSRQARSEAPKRG